MVKIGDNEEKYFDASMPFIEKMDDLNKLERYECLTVIQCVLLFIAYNRDNIEDLDEAIYAFYTLAMLDISKGELQALHPETLLPMTQYFRLIEAGIYGDEGLDAPIVHAGYLITLDECKRWFSTKGIHFDFTGLKSDLDTMKAKSKDETATFKTSRRDPLEPDVTITEHDEKKTYDGWKLSARQIGIRIYQKTPRLSIEQIAQKTYEIMKAKSITGRGGRVPSASTIKRHALNGLKI